MNYPAELQYSRDHEWLRMEDGVAVIGISDFAQSELGDVVFVNLPQEGDETTAGEPFGTVCAVNEELLDAPEKLNEDPYGTWIIKVENVTETEDMLSAAEYEAMCSED